MPIRLSHSCSHCQALSADHTCQVHEVKVSSEYTCDQFSLKPKLTSARHCKTCARYGQKSCAHPQKAAEGMLCSSWAPQA